MAITLEKTGYIPGTYDAEDYAEEWMWLTRYGVRSDEIIKRSRPGQKWFREHVQPLVSASRCCSCEKTFNPQEAGNLTRCTQTCGGGSKRSRP